MEQQTAVEYLFEQLPIRMQNYLQKEIEVAKEMEKAQRIKDYNAGYDDAQCNHINDAENYINESDYINSVIESEPLTDIDRKAISDYINNEIKNK